jgi:uncharacterized protein (TIGR02453 family)
MPNTLRADACLPAEGLEFLRRLKKNNTTVWFHAHKDEYRGLVREPMARVVTAVNRELERFAPDYVTTKKDPLSRPNRDTRFSTDKSPYRTDVSVVFPRAGLEKHEAAGFFIRIDSDGVELIAGAYMPGPEQLQAFRRYLDTDHANFRKLATARALVGAFGSLTGDRLVRVHGGFPADHAAADFLRLKQVYVRKVLDAKMAMSPRLVDGIATAFRAAAPMVEAIDAAFASS